MFSRDINKNHISLPKPEDATVATPTMAITALTAMLAVAQREPRVFGAAARREEESIVYVYVSG